MALGLGLLGFSPAHFWSLTPKELEAAITGRLGRTAQPADLARADLTSLMQRFPDHASLSPLAGRGSE